MRKNQTTPVKIKKNDTVRVIAGNSRGSRGKVLKVFPKTRRVIIEGVNFIKRHTKPRSQTDPGGIQEREAPIHVSNVALICPKCGAETRVGMFFADDGSKARVCKKCQEMIDA
ncbi:MAG: 50S ribosomal protein L24 [bacterium]